MLRKILARSALLLALIMLISCQPGIEPETVALPTEAALAALAATETRPPAATEAVATPRPTQTDMPIPATDTPVATTALLEATATPIPIEPTATAEPWYGEFEGTFYRGSPSAPVRLIDYSDFLWPNCRAYVLGTEKQLAAEFVDSGQLQMVFWPVLNHGEPSVYSTLTAFCVGWQDPALFWEIHDQLFTDQTSLWRADRAYFVSAATAVGADQAAFESCYDDPASVTHILDLDTIRRERGISGQPVFDINGQLFFGAPPFDIFAGVIRTEIPDE